MVHEIEQAPQAPGGLAKTKLESYPAKFLTRLLRFKRKNVKGGVLYRREKEVNPEDGEKWIKQ